MQRRTTQHWAMLRVYEPPSALDCLHLVTLPYADDVPIKRGELLQLHRRCGLQHQQVRTVASWPMHWQPEGLHGDEGEEVEHPVLLEEISWVLKVLGLPMAVSSLPYPTIPYHTLPYPTIPYHTLPYPTIPYHTLPYPTQFSQNHGRRPGSSGNFLKSKSKVLLLQLPS